MTPKGVRGNYQYKQMLDYMYMSNIHIHIAPFLSNFLTQQLLKLTFKHIVNFRSPVGSMKVCSERRERERKGKGQWKV